MQKSFKNLIWGKTKASYKLCDGWANHLSEKLDECMLNAREKFFSILVLYYSEELKRVLVQHYKSASFTFMNANNLFDHIIIINSLSEDEIPITNLSSNLSDSTNYMWGKTAGFDSLLRKEAPYLLDVGGDTCHHVHNASTEFFVTIQ